jgi:hypothetical protein
LRELRRASFGSPICGIVSELPTIRPETEGRGEIMLEGIAAENNSLGSVPGDKLHRYDLFFP